MKKAIIIIVFVIYLLVSLLITGCLIQRNEYGIVQTKNYNYLFGVKFDKYDSNDLIRFKKVEGEKSVDKEVYYYLGYDVLQKGVVSSYKDGVYSIDSLNYYENQIVGSVDDSINGIGGFYDLFTNKIVYLFFIILPVLLLFIYEIYLFIIYLKETKKRKEDNNDESNNKKTEKKTSQKK